MGHINLYSDGSDRTPRPVQVQAKEWLQENWTKAKIKALQLPVGAGKSWLARTVQNGIDSATGKKLRAAIITPSNILVDQYRTVYPEINDLVGRAHYKCATYDGLNCLTVSEANLHEKGGYCPGCVYQCHKRAAMGGAPTFFNPMSWLYMNLQIRDDDPPFDVLIIDEAHDIVGMLQKLAGIKFWRSKHGFPDSHNEMDVIRWFDKIEPGLRAQQAQYVQAVVAAGTPKDKAEVSKRLREIEEMITSIYYLRIGLIEDPQNYAIWSEETQLYGHKDESLNIKPVRVPRHLIRMLFAGVKDVVLMSGTLLEHDLEDMVKGETYEFADFDSPIDKSRRLIHYKPVAYPVNFETTPSVLAKDILKTCAANPGNTIIHVTYAWSKKLAPYMPPNVLINTAENKKEVLAKFIKEGGIFLAAGCAEGIDLSYDLCRTNIIPVLAWPNLNDETVKKRKSLEGGEMWYKLETLKTTIQQAGRSTRAADDFSKTIVLVPAFKWLVNSCRTKLPKSFLDSLVGL